jgi:hypothetical protein
MVQFMLVAFAVLIMYELGQGKLHSYRCSSCGAGHPDRHHEDCPWK